jgi:hypothetical protein
VDDCAGKLVAKKNSHKTDKPKYKLDFIAPNRTHYRFCSSDRLLGPP